MAKGVMGNPVTLLVVVSPGVKFHSEECCLGWQTFPPLWRCSAALARPELQSSEC